MRVLLSIAKCHVRYAESSMPMLQCMNSPGTTSTAMRNCSGAHREKEAVYTVMSRMAQPVSGPHMQEAMGYNYVHVLWHVILPAYWLGLRLHATLKKVKRQAARH